MSRSSEAMKIKLSEENVGCSLCFVLPAESYVSMWKEEVKQLKDELDRLKAVQPRGFRLFLVVKPILAEGIPIKWVSVSTELRFRRLKYCT